METNYFIYIVVSGFFHALYNYKMRSYNDQPNFLASMFFIAAITAILTSQIANYNFIQTIQNPHLIYGAAFFYSLYQFFVSKAYETGDISMVYPLTVLSPAIIPIWALIFLNEQISIKLVLGICLAITGAVTIKLKSLSLTELNKAFRFSKDYTAGRYALISSVFYSIAAIFDKAAIGSNQVVPYMSVLLTFMAANLFIISAIRHYGAPIKKKHALPLKDNLLNIIFSGIIVYLSFITFREALKETYVSIAVPLRLVSILFATFLGIMFLHEKLQKKRAIGALLIIAGIAIISTAS